MFRRLDITLMSNPICSKTIDVEETDFLYYDKDGFELNKAEQKFYRANQFPVIDCLNHLCWQEPWFELEHDRKKLILDHSMFLCRASYEGSARDQLLDLKSTIPTADLLLRTRQKWGFDFALDAVADDGTVYEVVHVEFDSYNYDSFKTRMMLFEWAVRHTDWSDAADRIWDHRDKWQNLKGFDQNHWKAKFLLGWHRSEYTEKSF